MRYGRIKKRCARWSWRPFRIRGWSFSFRTLPRRCGKRTSSWRRSWRACFIGCKRRARCPNMIIRVIKWPNSWLMVVSCSMITIITAEIIKTAPRLAYQISKRSMESITRARHSLRSMCPNTLIIISNKSTKSLAQRKATKCTTSPTSACTPATSPKAPSTCLRRTKTSTATI